MTCAVVIPARNAADHIGRTIAAVLAQDQPADEVVVVDNASSDTTVAAARRAGARVISESRPGSYAARNAGIAATTAPVVAFTDADCVPHPGWLAALEQVLRDHPDVDVVGGAVQATGARTAAERWSEARNVLDQEQSFARPSYLPFFATANVAWRRDALVTIGGFDDQLTSGGDVDACWRLQRAGGQLAFAPDAVVEHGHRTRLRDLLEQQHRYASGHGRLDSRWGADPAYAAAAGTPLERLRAVWLLPLRVPWRAARRRDPALPILDALVRVTHEVGRARGRRLPPLDPMPAQPSSVTPATT